MTCPVMLPHSVLLLWVDEPANKKETDGLTINLPTSLKHGLFNMVGTQYDFT